MLTLRFSPFVALIITLILMFQVSGRQYSSKFNIPTFRRNDAWTFIDRIHLYAGHMTVRCEVEFQSGSIKQGSTYEMELVAIPESIWEKSLFAKCEDHKLTVDELSRRKTAEIVYHVNLNAHNNYKAVFTSKMEVPTE